MAAMEILEFRETLAMIKDKHYTFPMSTYL